MEIKDLESDTLRCIFGFVAQSGGENLARAITVCRMFQEIGNDRDILKNAVFSNATMSDNLHLFEQFNGVIRKAAQSGSTAAQILLAKIISMSSTQLLLSAADIAGDLFIEDRSSSHLSYASDDEISDAGTNDMEEEEEDETLASMFLSCFESAHSEAPSESLHHNHFVRMYWANCSPHDLSELSLDLHSYLVYFVDNVSFVNSLFFSFHEGIKAIQKYRHGLSESDNQEAGEALNQGEEQYNVDRDFVKNCKKIAVKVEK